MGIIFVTGDTAAALSVDQTAGSNPIINLQNNGDHVVTGDMNMGHINVIYYKSATMLKTVRCQLGDEAKDFKIFYINLTIASERVPLSSTPPSVQHIGSTQKGHSFSAPKNSSVPHQKTLSSTPPQFHISLSSTLLQFHTPAHFHNSFFGVELSGLLS